jgi:hypothetical protein
MTRGILHCAERLETKVDKTVREIVRNYEVLTNAKNLVIVSGPAREAHDRLLACFSAPRSELEITAILSSVDVQRILPTLRHLNAQAHRDTEEYLAQRYLTCAGQADPFKDSWINTGFTALLAGQVARWRAARIITDEEAKPIVMVGGGALPQTQVFLHRETGRSVVAIERDVTAATLAGEVLRKAGYNQRLSVVAEDGADYDYQSCSIVVVATLVASKLDIAARVALTCPTAFLSPRTPVGLHCLWREPLSVQEFGKLGWMLVDKWAPNGSSVAALTFKQ